MSAIAAGASTRDDHSDERPVLLNDGQVQAQYRVPEKPLLSRGPLEGGARPVYHRQGDAASPPGAQRLECRRSSDRCRNHFFFCTLTFPHLVSDTFFIAVCGDIRGQYVRILPLNLPTDRTTHTRRDRSMTSCSCSISEASCRILATSSWVTTSAKPISALKCAAPGSSFLNSCDSGHVVCAISMGAQNLVPRLVLPSSWEPRVRLGVSGQLFHAQARM